MNTINTNITVRKKNILRITAYAFAGIACVTFVQYTTAVALGSYLVLSHKIIIYGVSYFIAGLILHALRASRMEVITFFIGLLCLSVAAPIIKSGNFPFRSPGFLIASILGYIGSQIYFNEALSLKLKVAYTLFCGMMVYSILTYIPRYIYYREVKKSFFRNNIPSFRLFDVDRKVYTKKIVDNKYVIFDFWRLGCKPCMEKFLAYSELKDNVKNRILIVAIDDGRADNFNEFKRFVEKRQNKDGGRILFLYDAKGTFSRYMGVELFPVEFILNKNGSVIHKEDGYSRIYKKEFIKFRQRLLE